jgi:hypothetical protein
MRRFMQKDFQMDYGMRKLMELFYSAVRDDSPDPIPTSEILRTSRIMESIFQQVPRNRA